MFHKFVSFNVNGDFAAERSVLQQVRHPNSVIRPHFIIWNSIDMEPERPHFLGFLGIAFPFVADKNVAAVLEVGIFVFVKV